MNLGNRCSEAKPWALAWIFHIELQWSVCRQREGLLFEGRRDQGG